MTSTETSLLLNRKAVSNLLSLSVRSIDLLLADGRLTPIKFGNRVLVSRKQVEQIARTGVTGGLRC
jgi:hypothetical protein